MNVNGIKLMIPKIFNTFAVRTDFGDSFHALALAHRLNVVFFSFRAIQSEDCNKVSLAFICLVIFAGPIFSSISFASVRMIIVNCIIAKRLAQNQFSIPLKIHHSMTMLRGEHIQPYSQCSVFKIKGRKWKLHIGEIDSLNMFAGTSVG